MDKEFEDKCLNERTVTIKPTVVMIKRPELIAPIANQHKNNSDYFLEGSQNLLKSNTPLLAILMGYFAMEHKANQLLALNGYKMESHICTQIALSRILGRKDLARKISEVFELRQNVGYRMFLKHNEEEMKNSEKVINGIVIHFIVEIDELIKKLSVKK